MHLQCLEKGLAGTLKVSALIINYIKVMHYLSDTFTVFRKCNRHRAGLVGVGLSGQQARHIPCLPMAGHLFDGYVH